MINAMREAIDADHDRFTGLSTQGSARVTLHVVDTAALDEEPLHTLLADAWTAEIDLDVTPGARPLRDLNRIHAEILSTDPFRAHGVRAAGFGIDPASGTVQVRVAASAVEVMRKAFAVHGEAVVVTGEPLEDSPETLPPYDGPRDGWREPPPDLIGRTTDDAVRLLVDQHFTVEVFHRGDPMLFTMDLRPDRVRLLVHDGLVIDARQA